MVALEGMKTSCGATLIASQTAFRVEDVGGLHTGISSRFRHQTNLCDVQHPPKSTGDSNRPRIENQMKLAK
ncbi:hypothetical protein [Photorhabdus stackebrandtii]|uniref:hypothetical protein n=1 Tax=Photorhabdus stackebrandtii TaxID=1123042 RepID=UPI003BB73C56